MATTPNQKAVPSEDYVNMRFNAGKLDEFINATYNTYIDRTGVTHLTVTGLQATAIGALIPANNLSDVASVVTARSNLGLGSVAVETTVPVSKGGTGSTTAIAARAALSAAKSGANTDITSITGVASTATVLATARALQTNLASTSSANFDGSANASPGVTGTLPLANGGTGSTSAAGARSQIDAASLTGVTDGATVAAGKVGQILSNTGTSISVSTSIVTNITSLTLPAGDWDLQTVFQILPAGGAAPTSIVVGQSNTSATSAGFNNSSALQISLPANASQIMPLTTTSINTASSVTIYAVAQVVFSAGSCTVNAYIKARRIR